MTKNMYTVSGDGPCNEELALRMQVGDKNAAGQLVSQNEGYLTDLARAYTPWCEMEDLKQEAALALLDAAERSDPAYGKAADLCDARDRSGAVRLRRAIRLSFARPNQPRQPAPHRGVLLRRGAGYL